MSPSSEPYVCSADHAGWLSTPVRRLITDPRRMLKGLAGPGDVVMDVGCGPGFFTLPLAEAVGATAASSPSTCRRRCSRRSASGPRRAA